MKIANKIVMIAAGVVFIAATALKAYQLLTEPIISTGFWESWEFFVIQIPLELGLGIWLICGLFRKAAWLLGVLSFGLFICVTLQKGLIGAESCGCFGTVHVNPWITLFAMDVPFFVLLLIFRPKGEKLLPPPWPSAKHFFGVAIPTFVLLATILPVLIFNRVERQEIWTKNEPSSPTTQNEQEWSMLKHIDIADSVRTEMAIILFYHYDCPDCREAIPRYEQMNSELAGNEDAIRIAFIETPPYGPEDESPIPAETRSLTGRLDASEKWYFTTPLVVVIRDGIVIKSWEAKAPALDEILDAVFNDG